MAGDVEWGMFLLAAVALTVAPGPDNLFVLMLGMTHGRRPALAAAWGMASGNVVHTVGLTLGVSALLAASPLAFQALRMAGAGYLLWLAWRQWTAPPARTPGAVPPAGLLRWFRRGVLMNVLNPKVALFFLAFVPPFIPPDSRSPAVLTLTLGALFIAQVLVIFSLFALGAEALGRWWRRHPALLRWSPRATALVLAGLAVWMLAAQ